MDYRYVTCLCTYCGKREYSMEMRWLNGRCLCRECYKALWKSSHE